MSLGGTIVVADKKARLKPCLRCGYSLVRLTDARRCPECGLAIRISLSNNDSLAWSNPHWQRFLAVAFGLMATGFACTILSSAGYWLIWGFGSEYDGLNNSVWFVIDHISRLTSKLSLIICGISLCLLGKGEGRHPDQSLGVRRLALGAGIIFALLGAWQLAVRYEISVPLPYWIARNLYRVLSGPWIPAVFAISICACARVLGKRSGSRRLSRMSQLPLYPVAIGFWVWLLDLQRLFWPLPSIVWEWAYPLSMIIALVVTTRALLRNAREAEMNWATET